MLADRPDVIDLDVSASGSVVEEEASCSGCRTGQVALVRIGETQLDVLPVRLRLTAGAVRAGAVQWGWGSSFSPENEHHDRP